jgi:16S rRNA (cytidine1402-2'-O)-methyltransferase
LPPPDALDDAVERDAEGERTWGPAASKPAPGLYLAATPIGNAGDITVRALHALAGADVVYCEDTRVTRRLMAIYRLQTPLAAYHEHNAERVRPAVLARLARGETVVLASDAGMPLISDPGYKLVRDAVAAGHPVTCLPGASAPLAALLLSGLPADRFLFAGFPPPRGAARRRFWRELAAVPASLIAFETAPRLADSLADAAAELGDRPAAVARELTKKFEEVRRGTLSGLADHYRAAGPPRGEITLVVGGGSGEPAAWDDAAVDRALSEALGRSSLRDAAAEIAAASGRPRREVYRRALALAAAPDDASAEDGTAGGG